MDRFDFFLLDSEWRIMKFVTESFQNNEKENIMDRLALTNRLEIMLNKPKEEFKRSDFIQLLQKGTIERFTFHYTALDGKLKELRLPITSVPYAEQLLAEGERVDGSSLFKGMVDASVSDLYVVPLYKSAFINPFDEKSLDFICRYMNRDGELAPFGLDSILENASRLFRERTGYELYALGELEFYLIRDLESDIYPNVKQMGYHAASPFFKNGDILNEMMKTIASVTGAVKYAHGEVGYIDKIRSDLPEIKGKTAEQMEIEFLPRPITEMADYLVLSKWIIRNIAYKYNAVATFTPKLEEGIAGNGMHFHLAVMKNGENVMLSPDGKLSEESLRLIAGLCLYADSLTAFGNTVSSAYLRLVPNQEAPTKICWSDMNRSAMIRVPLGWRNVSNLAEKINYTNEPLQLKPVPRQTVELRSPDGSALIHLILAGICMAAEEGFSRPDALEIAQKHYVTGNIFQDRKILKKLSPLPGSCVESARILEKKRYLYEREGVFKKELIDYIIRMLLKENDERMNERLMDMPADDRLHETRKIMHKDLHKH